MATGEAKGRPGAGQRRRKWQFYSGCIALSCEKVTCKYCQIIYFTCFFCRVSSMFPCSVLILLESEEGEVWAFYFLGGFFVVFYFIFIFNLEDIIFCPFSSVIKSQSMVHYLSGHLVMVRYNCHLNHSAPAQMSNEWVLGRNQAFYFMWSSVQNFKKESFRERHGTESK